MGKIDRLCMAEKNLSRKVVMALIIVLGVVSASVAGLCYCMMDIAGLLAFNGFLLFSAVVVGCVGALLVYIREGQGLY